MPRLDRLRTVVTRVLNDVPEVAAVYVYGSQAEGKALPLSDLDLAFVLRSDVRPEDPLFAERLSARIASGLDATAATSRIWPVARTRSCARTSPSWAASSTICSWPSRR